MRRINLFIFNFKKRSKINSRLQKNSEGKVIDNEIFRAIFLNKGGKLFLSKSI